MSGSPRNAYCSAARVLSGALALALLAGCTAPSSTSAPIAATPAAPSATAASPAPQVTASVATSPTPAVRFAPPKIAVRRMDAIAFSGTVRGVALNHDDTMSVRIFKLVGGKWRLRRTVTPNRKRLGPMATTWTIRYRPRERGSYKAQALLTAGDSRFKRAWSNPVTFRSVSRRYIALTFDDGPWPTSTNRVLNALAKVHAKATFFMIGQALTGNKAIARHVVRDGQLVAVHTMSHPDLARMGNSAIRSQLARCRSLIHAVTGKTATWYRPPGGATSARVRAVARGLHLREMLWTVDTNDWRGPSASVIRARVRRGARPGAVVLMHDGGGNRKPTAAAVPGILHDLSARGYDFVNMNEWAALQ